MLIQNINIEGRKVEYIDRKETLQAASEALRQCKEIAVDLEFDRNRYRYGFNLCLVQIEAEHQLYIIDPLAPEIGSLQSLFDIFEDERVMKIMHSPNEDISLLKTHNCNPKNVADTEYAARLLDIKGISLGALLTSELDITLNKALQTSNWNHRPLSFSQIVYAAHDVLHLRQLYHQLMARLEVSDRFAWYDDLCRELENTVYVENPNPHLKMTDAARLAPFNQHILQSIYKWRDAIAKRLDMPPSNIVSNATLVEWAVKPASSLDEWVRTRGLIKRYRELHEFNRYQTIVERAVTEAKEQKMATIWSRLPRQEGVYLRSRDQAELIREDLKTIRMQVREQYGESVAGLILSANQSDDIARGKPLASLRPFALPLVLKIAEELKIDFKKYGLV